MSLSKLVPLALLAFFVMLQVGAPKAMAAGNPIGGYAWSDNIGWISMSGANYGLSVAANDTISGYAWSDNIGWVSAMSGDVSGCPSGTCIPSLQSDGMHGWLKALAGGTVGSGGWDGWISLSGIGTNGDPYGVTLQNNGTNFQGYAWGDIVVGWVNFARATYGPTASLLVNGAPSATVAYNDRATLTWSSTSAASCTAPSGNWSNLNPSPGHGDSLNGDGLTDPLAVDSTFTFQCTDSGGQSSPLQSVTVTVHVCTPGQIVGAGGVCTNGPGSTVDGACDPSSPHACSNGTTPATFNDNASYWIWDCLGSNGGNPASCSKPKVAACGGTFSPLITATPSRVHAGDITHITWSATTGVMTSCIISKNGTTIATIPAVSCSLSNGGISPDPTINSQTTYCITCDNHTTPDKCVIVNILPGFKEF